MNKTKEFAIAYGVLLGIKSGLSRVSENMIVWIDDIYYLQKDGLDVNLLTLSKNYITTVNDLDSLYTALETLSND